MFVGRVSTRRSLYAVDTTTNQQLSDERSVGLIVVGRGQPNGCPTSVGLTAVEGTLADFCWYDDSLSNTGLLNTWSTPIWPTTVGLRVVDGSSMGGHSDHDRS